MAKQAPKKKGANGYKLPDPLPQGEVLCDLSKKKWKLGKSIGQGGFGEIYSAQDLEKKSNVYPYVVKIEPHENGPLFVEINFYIRNAKSQDVEEFKKQKKLKTFGMPVYLGSGSHEHDNLKYRFLVMDKFGTDIWKLFLDNGKVFPVTTVFKLGVQILDVLEYIHDRGYVHADIKGANVLLGLNKDSRNQIFLVDFGLATKYVTDGEFKPNPKKAHDGTIEYLSRDAHCGVPTMRGDLEILAYNLIQWLGCTLPWEKNLSNPVEVHDSKKQNMSNENTFLKKCFGSKPIPAGITDFIKYTNKLAFKEKPNYSKVRKMFISEIEKTGEDLLSPFVFNEKAKVFSPTKRKVPEKKVSNKKLKKDNTQIEDEVPIPTEENDEQVISKPTRGVNKRTKKNDNQTKNEEVIPSEENDDQTTAKPSKGAIKKSKKDAEAAISTKENGDQVIAKPSRGAIKKSKKDDEASIASVENNEEKVPKTSKTSNKRLKKNDTPIEEDKKETTSGENDEEVIPKTERRKNVKKSNKENSSTAAAKSVEADTVKSKVEKENGVSMESVEEKPENDEIKRIKSKIEGKTDVSEDFDGFTPEMKALAMKKLQNGTKKTNIKKPRKKNVTNTSDNSEGTSNGKTDLEEDVIIERSPRNTRRNIKVVNYSQSPM